MKKRLGIAGFGWRRWRWLAVMAVVCLVLAPVLSTLGMASAFAVPPSATESVPGHHHADGTAHHHGAEAHQTKQAGNTKSDKSHAACADGCCLGKGCPLCSLGLSEAAVPLIWFAPGCFASVPFPAAAGIVPPPPSEPPRA